MKGKRPLSAMEGQRSRLPTRKVEKWSVHSVFTLPLLNKKATGTLFLVDTLPFSSLCTKNTSKEGESCVDTIAHNRV
jgi:hypothetical protein